VVYEYNRKNKDNITVLGWSPKFAGKGRRPAKLWGQTLDRINNFVDEATKNAVLKSFNNKEQAIEYRDRINQRIGELT
jgi:hypothetical protein